MNVVAIIIQYLKKYVSLAVEKGGHYGDNKTTVTSALEFYNLV